MVERRKTNLRADKPRVNQHRFWRDIVVAICTTQNPSGRGSAVEKLVASNPFPLAYARCADERRLHRYVGGVLAAFGFRFAPDEGQPYRCEFCRSAARLGQGIADPRRAAATRITVTPSGKPPALSRRISEDFSPASGRSSPETFCKCSD